VSHGGFLKGVLGGSPRKKSEQIVRRYHAGERVFRQDKLEEAVLTGANLADADPECSHCSLAWRQVRS
jgi:hypothetical protein